MKQDNPLGEIFSMLLPLLLKSQLTTPNNDLPNNDLPNITTQNNELPNNLKSSNSNLPANDGKLDVEFFEQLLSQVAPIIIKEVFKAKPELKNMVKKIIEEIQNENVVVEENVDVVVKENVIENVDVVGNNNENPYETPIHLCDFFDAKSKQVPRSLKNVYLHMLKNADMFPELKTHSIYEMNDTLRYVAEKISDSNALSFLNFPFSFCSF